MLGEENLLPLQLLVELAYLVEACAVRACPHAVCRYHVPNANMVAPHTAPAALAVPVAPAETRDAKVELSVRGVGFVVQGFEFRVQSSGFSSSVSSRTCWRLAVLYTLSLTHSPSRTHSSSSHTHTH